MFVIVPYVDLQPQTIDALSASGHDWDPMYVGWSDRAYWSVLAAMWDLGETFAVVEQDVIIEPDTLTRLEQCDRPWCAHATPYLHGQHVGMGCVKFGASLIAADPLAMQKVGEMFDLKHPAKHWCRLDAWLQTMTLPFTGIERHVHPQVLGHVRAYDGVPQPTHGCMDLVAPV